MCMHVFVSVCVLASFPGLHAQLLYKKVKKAGPGNEPVCVCGVEGMESGREEVEREGKQRLLYMRINGLL